MVALAGDTTIEAPVPITALPQLPLYQFHEAPVPSEPPDILNVVGLEGQTGLVLALALTGPVDVVFTLTVTLAQAVVLQVPTAAI